MPKTPHREDPAHVDRPLHEYRIGIHMDGPWDAKLAEALLPLLGRPVTVVLEPIARPRQGNRTAQIDEGHFLFFDPTPPEASVRRGEALAGHPIVTLEPPGPREDLRNWWASQQKSGRRRPVRSRRLTARMGRTFSTFRSRGLTAMETARVILSRCSQDAANGWADVSTRLSERAHGLAVAARGVSPRHVAVVLLWLLLPLLVFGASTLVRPGPQGEPAELVRPLSGQNLPELGAVDLFRSVQSRWAEHLIAAQLPASGSLLGITGTSAADLRSGRSQVPPPQPVGTAGRVVPAGRTSGASPSRRPAPRFAGTLRVDSDPRGAEVVVNGRPAGTTPLVLSGVSAGSHAVRVQLAGHRRWSTSARVVSDQETRLMAPLRPAASR